jgi:HlyD family secretion protein
MRYRRAAAAGVAVVLVGAAATAARAQTGDDTARYRLATATLGDVEQTLSLNGTVEHANRADVGFGVSGQVAEVYVEDGDHVRAGQKLAALDTTDLEAAVTGAKAALAQAKAQLEADQNAQEDLVEDATTQQPQQQEPQKPQPQQPEQPQPEQPDQPNPALQEALKELAAQQEAVRSAQTAATEAIAAAKAALAEQQTACEPVDGVVSADCDDALAAVQQAQDAVAAAQDDLQLALSVLGKTLSDAIAATSDQGGNEPASAAEGDSVVVPAIAMEAPSKEDAATTSAGSIADDQAAIDQAEADLLAAEQQLAAAVLRAPRAGQVAAIDVARGENVDAGTPAVTIIGRGKTTVAASATADQVDSLEAGQEVTVTVPGRERKLTGHVESIGLLPESGQDQTSFPVTVSLDGGRALPTGSTASLAVVVRTAADVVTVPASAVVDGEVRVLEGDGTATKKVTVGAVGATTLEVSGIEAGTRVVLADRDADLPSTDSSLPGGGDIGEMRQRFVGPGGGGPATFKNG